ncbi:MAG: DUF2298 domain-containing protein [Acidobacteriota bacterium]|nr:DUF2298 domain-containing protein [Acidobacteriota bacterium]
MSSRSLTALLALLVAIHLTAILAGQMPLARSLAPVTVLFTPGLGCVLALQPRSWRPGALFYYSLFATFPVFLGAALLSGGHLGASLVSLDIITLGFLLWSTHRPSMILRPRQPRGAAWVAAGLTAIVAAGVILSPSFRASYHGLLHSSIVYQVSRTGIPPENPYFAGEPLHYYWGFHLLGALIGKALGIDPLSSLSILRLGAATGLPLATARLGRRIAPRRLNSAVASIAGLAGLNGLGWLFLLGRSDEFLGLWREGANPLGVLSLMSWGFNRRLAAGLTIALNLSGFGLGIAVGLVAVEQAALVARGKGARAAVAAVLLVATSILINPLAGAAALLILAGTTIGALWPARGRWNRAAWLGLACGVGGLVLAAPYLLSITGGETRDLLRFVRPRLWQGLCVLGPLILIALPAGIAECRLRPLRRWLPIGLAACFPALAGTVMRLPAQDEYYFLRAAALPLGFFGAATLRGARGRWRGIMAMASFLVFVPPTAIVATAYFAAARRPMPLVAAGDNLILLPRSRDETRAYDYLRNQTPPNSVIVEQFSKQQLSFRPAQGSDVPVFAQRDEYLGYNSGVTRKTRGMLIGGYRDLRKRKKQLARLFGSPCHVEIVKEIHTELGRPVYVLARPGSKLGDRMGHACLEASELLERVFESHSVRIYKVVETRQTGLKIGPPEPAASEAGPRRHSP